MMLLALDLARSTGYAVGDVEQHERLTPLETAGRGDNLPSKPISGSHIIASEAATLGRFGVRLDNWLTDMITVHQPKHIVFEAPWVDGNTHQATALKLMGMAFMTATVATRLEVPNIFKANNSTVRKHFLGTGRGARKTLKRLTIQACQARGWDPRNDDEADALALFDYACHCLAD